MEVLVVRHAVAMNREEAASQGISDADRPVTARGWRKMKRGAKGLVAYVPRVSTILTSPLVRARETATILRRAYRGVPIVETQALLPDEGPAKLVEFLGRSDEASPIVVVGHEPHLSHFVGYCLAGRPRPFIELRKGGACMLAFEHTPGEGTASLRWLAPPDLLRRLGRG